MSLWGVRECRLKINFFKGVSGKLLEIHRNERCEAASSRDSEQIHEKRASQTGG